MSKRICLFAGYDQNGIIHDYVIYFIKELSELSEVHYFADCEITESEIAKLKPYVKSAKAFRHEKYDFGSWSEMLLNLGNDYISQFDQLILTNDSCYGPLFPLSPIFQKMESEKKDFWGLTLNEEFTIHLQSFFLVFNNTILRNEKFWNFLTNIEKKENTISVIHSYEIAFTLFLNDLGFTYTAFLKKKKNIMRYPILSFNAGIPLIKVKIFKELWTSRESIVDIDVIIREKSGYPFELVEKHLNLDMKKWRFELCSKNKRQNIWAYTKLTIPYNLPFSRLARILMYIVFQFIFKFSLLIKK